MSPESSTANLAASLDELGVNALCFLAVEAGVSQGWHRYVGSRGDVLAVDRFGVSAPGAVVMREFGFSVDNVCTRALALVEALRRT